MTLEDALRLIEAALAPYSLSELQIDIFSGTWNKQSYRSISLELNHEYSYVKDVGAELWQLLTQQLGIQVTKLNLQDALAEYVLDQQTPGLAASPRSNIDWGEAPSISEFCGREQQLSTLEQWVMQDHCRLIAIVGIGGIGKTMLVTRLAQQLAETEHFQITVWRSLRQAPPLSELLNDLLQAISPQQQASSQLDVLMRQVLERLRQHRCLLILDNLEAVLHGGELVGTYLPRYEDYGWLLEQLGAGQHQSSILLTSREVPTEVATLSGGSKAVVRLLRLESMLIAEGAKILASKGLLMPAKQAPLQELIERYQGNPLALKIVATPIRDLYDSNIAAFLAEETQLFKDIRDLLAHQFNRLSSLERQVMYWLAINRETVTASQLETDLLPSVSQGKLRDALISLDQRSLIERIQPNSAKPTALMKLDCVSYTQQPVVMEYVNEQLIEQVYQEVQRTQIDCLRNHALMKAQAKDYVRDIQIRLIVQPILARLIESQGGSENLKHLLLQLLETQQAQAPLQPGYFAGNIINLLRQLGIELSHLDFSNLMIWQADLRMANLQKTNFSRADLNHSIFTQALNNILYAAFSPDGQRFATSHVGGEICVWQIKDGQQTAAFQGVVSFAKSIAFSPDGETLVVSNRDQIVKRLHIPSKTVRGEFYGHVGAVLSVAISIDGRFLASSGEDPAIRVWDMETGVCLKTLEQQQYWLVTLAFDPTSQIPGERHRLASGGGDQAIRLWDVETGQILQTFKGHTQAVLAVAFSPDGQILASSSADQTIRLWNARTGGAIAVWQAHDAPIWALAFSPDGQTLVSGSEDQTIKLWDVKTQHCYRTLLEHTAMVQSVAYSPDGLTLLSAAVNQSMRLWDAQTGHCLKTWQGYSKIVFNVAFHPDGQVIASCHGDKALRLWDVQTGDCLNCVQGHADHVSCVAFSPNGQLLASGSFDQTIRLWDVHSGNFLRTFRTRGWVTSVAFSPDGTLLVGSGRDRVVRFWDVRTGRCLRVVEPGVNWIEMVAFSPRQHCLASAGQDGTVKLWDTDTSQCLLTLEGHTKRTQTIAFDPTAQRLVSGSDDHTMKVWDLQTGQCLQTLQGHNRAVKSISIHPQGHLLASGSLDHTLKLWDLQQGASISTLQGHTGSIRSIAFDPEGRIIVSGSEDGTIRLWDSSTGNCLRILTVNPPYEGMNISGVTGVTDAQKETLRVLGAIEC
jgi:WD40 repeat protein